MGYKPWEQLVGQLYLGREAFLVQIDVRKAGGGTVRDQGSYVVSWRKADSRWKAFSDLFHSSLPR
jgi:hypothetical protein